MRKKLRADLIDWRSEPLPEEAITYPIWTPTVAERVEAVILSSEVVVVPTHYLDGRTQPHLRDPTLCDGCVLGKPIRSKGYLAAMDPRDGRQYLLEIPSQSLSDATDLRSRAGQLRGVSILLTRIGPRENSKVHVQLGITPLGIENLPPEFDVQAALIHIWTPKERPNKIRIKGRRRGDKILYSKETPKLGKLRKENRDG